MNINKSKKKKKMINEANGSETKENRQREAIINANHSCIFKIKA
jgi:hypothetical protein